MSNKSFKYLGISLIFLLTHAYATTYFVRSGASGNGTSWANAWGNVSSISWSAINAGDTVCVAGGTYSGGIAFGNSGTSGNPITVKRATSADAVCGSGTAGWNSAYDAQAVIASVDAGSTSYVTLDGAVWNGFKINFADCPGQTCRAVGAEGATDHITIRYLEIAGPCNGLGNNATCQDYGDPRGINPEVWTGQNYASNSNWLIQYNNIHGQCDLIYAINASNWIIEHNRLADAMAYAPPNTPTCHDNVLISNGTTGTIFRYNEVTNWHVEGLLMCPTSGGCTANGDVYGNVWHDPATDSYPRFFASQYGQGGIWHFYNNTFVNFTNFACYSNENSGAGLASGSAAYNNLYFGNGFGADCGFPMGEDYAYSDKALSEAHGQGNAPNPFVDSTAKTIAGYHVTTHTKAGLNLGSPYNSDYDGNARVNWDRGAFEYTGGNSKVNPPTNITVVSAQ